MTVRAARVLAAADWLPPETGSIVPTLMATHEPVLVLPRAGYGHDRRTWLQTRTQGIGASEAPAILGVDRYESPLSVYVKKVHPDAEDSAGEKAYWGNQLEHIVAREFQKRRGAGPDGRIAPSPGILAHPRYPWMRATIDREVRNRCTGAKLGPLECKTTDARNADDWPADAAPPARVIVQLMHQLAVTGDPRGWAAVLIGGNTYRAWEIVRDDEMIDGIIEVEAAFWEHVTSRTPPAPIGHDSDLDALVTLYPGDRDREAVLDPVWVEMLFEHRALKSQIKAAEARVAEIQASILAVLGDATEGLHPETGETVVTYRPSSTTRVDTKRLAAERPEIAEQYSRETPTRSFLRKDKKLTPVALTTTQETIHDAA